MKPAKSKAPKKEGEAKPKKEYSLPGQKRDTPAETDALRKFYATLREEKPESAMAEEWLLAHGLLPRAEAAAALDALAGRKGKAGVKGRAVAASPAARAAPRDGPKSSGKKKKAVESEEEGSESESEEKVGRGRFGDGLLAG